MLVTETFFTVGVTDAWTLTPPLQYHHRMASIDRVLHDVHVAPSPVFARPAVALALLTLVSACSSAPAESGDGSASAHDQATPADLAAGVDLSRSPDLSAPDLNASPDIAMSVDLATPPDLTPRDDLARSGCMGNADCDPGSFCKLALQPGCGGAGMCAPRPMICPGIYLPVCGCDKMTYDNACVANSAGQNYSKMGSC
jgi:hypothetical protein